MPYYLNENGARVPLGRSVAGIAVHGRLFFVARRKNDSTSMGGRWEFPGGKVEAEESDEIALAREFLEEFAAPIRAIRYLGEIGFTHKGQLRALAAWEIALSPRSVLILNEHSEVAWLPLKEVASIELADSDRALLPLIAKAFDFNLSMSHLFHGARFLGLQYQSSARLNPQTDWFADSTLGLQLPH